MRAVHKVCEAFEKETEQSASISDAHPYPAFTKDFQKILGVIEDMKVFIPLEERKHSCFALKGGLLQSLPKNKLVELIEKNVDQITSP